MAFHRRIAILFLCVIFLSIPLASCSENDKRGTGPVVEIELERGIIQVRLDSDAAPATVGNFVKLVEEGFYDGLTIHYIIPGTLIQGGDPEGTGQGGLPDKIPGEFLANGHENPISFERGVIGMARRSSDYNSASCQFFITAADVSYFDELYAGFGYVVKGMDVVDGIAAMEADGRGVPAETVVIKSIRIKG